MKKLIFVLTICICLLFPACKNIKKASSQYNIENAVAVELEKMDDNFSDETLKAMSVVIRTNLLINPIETQKKATEKYKKLTLATKDLVLKNNKNNLVEISFEDNNDYLWKKTIKKSEILNFALQNNINLSSISNIEPVWDNNKVLGLKIGEKFFDYELLKTQFGLESNEITNISQTKSDIIINGKNKGMFRFFDTYKAEQLSNNNQIFDEILNDFFNNLKLIKN